MIPKENWSFNTNSNSKANEQLSLKISELKKELSNANLRISELTMRNSEIKGFSSISNNEDIQSEISKCQNESIRVYLKVRNNLDYPSIFEISELDYLIIKKQQT